MNVNEQVIILERIKEICINNECSTCPLKDVCDVICEDKCPCYWEL